MRKLRLLRMVALVFLKVCLRRLFGGGRNRAWSLSYEAAVQFLFEQGLRMRDWPAAAIRRTTPDARIPKRLRAQLQFERGELGGVPVETITPEGWCTGRGEVLYLHGGGYAICSPGTHRGIGSGLAKASGGRVHLVEYRLAPEHPFPAALDDAKRAYAALCGGETVAARPVVAGDSAGGGLTVALAQSEVARGGQAPAGLVLFSPWLDLTGSTESIHENARFDYLQPEQIERYADWYLQGHDANDPLASPLFADLTGFPPLWLAYGELEVLRDESRLFLVRAAEHGLDTEQWVGSEMVHMWQAFAPISPDARASIRRAGRWIAERFV